MPAGIKLIRAAITDEVLPGILKPVSDPDLGVYPGENGLLAAWAGRGEAVGDWS